MDTDPTDATPQDTEATDTEATGPDATGTDAIGTDATDATPHDTRGMAARPVHSEQRLHRAGRGRMLGGVALGLADYFDIDPTLVRIAFVALAFLGGLAVPLYLAGWVLIPDEDTDLSFAEELLSRERSRAW